MRKKSVEGGGDEESGSRYVKKSKIPCLNKVCLEVIY